MRPSSTASTPTIGRSAGARHGEARTGSRAPMRSAKRAVTSASDGQHGPTDPEAAVAALRRAAIDRAFDEPVGLPVRYGMTKRATPQGDAVIITIETPASRTRYVMLADDVLDFAEALKAAAGEPVSRLVAAPPGMRIARSD